MRFTRMAVPAFPESAGPPPPSSREFTWRRAGRYLGRATRLRCVHCGLSPMFLPVLRTRKLSDWFQPLDGCPRCGYPYEREIGYFLLAIWAVNYGFSVILSLVIYAVLEWKFSLSTPALIAAVIAPIAVFSFLFARHSKSYFLAFDHFFDPPVPDRDDGDSGGNVPAPRPEAPAPPPSPAVTAR